MSQTIAVTVSDFSVTHCIDPKSKTEVPAKFKPKAINTLKAVQVDPPKGKTLGAYSVDITVAIKTVPKGLRAEVEVLCNNQDPYSKKDKFIKKALGGGTIQTPNPDKGDTEAAVQAALDTALATAITIIKADAKNP